MGETATEFETMTKQFATYRPTEEETAAQWKGRVRASVHPGFTGSGFVIASAKPDWRKLAGLAFVAFCASSVLVAGLYGLMA